jgi:uncharacterized repeat protein (TIGR01451 family)
MKNWRSAATLSAAAVVLLSASAFAQEDEQPQALVIAAFNQMADDARHQEVARQGGDANALLPGDVILYRLTFTNITDVQVRNVELKDPVPAGLHYVDGSATADREDVTITYSIDGGQTFMDRPMIEQVIDGERVVNPAPPEMYTHIRWLVSDWVQPGAQVTAEFTAQLPANEVPEEPGQPSEGPGNNS